MNDPRQPGAHPIGTNPSHPPVAPRPSVHPQPLHPQAVPSIRPQGAPLPAIHAPRPAMAPAPMSPAPRTGQMNDEPIALVEDAEELIEEKPASPVPSKIKFGPDIGHKQHNWKRKTHVTGTGACRLRSFHAKYSDQGIENLDNQINEWLDDHPDIEIKFCTTTVHVFEGKIREPAIVMNLWY